MIRGLAGEEGVIAPAGHPVVTLKAVVAKPGRELGTARGPARELTGWDGGAVVGGVGGMRYTRVNCCTPGRAAVPPVTARVPIF
jgi:hypothetical protein